MLNAELKNVGSEVCSPEVKPTGVPSPGSEKEHVSNGPACDDEQMAHGRTGRAGKGRCEAGTGSAWIHGLWREVDARALPSCHLTTLRSGQGLCNRNPTKDPGWMGLGDGPSVWRSEGQNTASGVREREESEMRWGCVVRLRWRVCDATQIRRPVKKTKNKLYIPSKGFAIPQLAPARQK